MLKGENIQLRHVRERDLDVLYDLHTDISSRGDFYPLGTYSEPGFKKEFQETGFWKSDDGLLLIVDNDDTLLGEIQFFRTVDHLDELEIGYRLYSPEYGGRGIMTEALTLLTAFLFDQKRFNRIRLNIHRDNAASLRIAEKCGYQHEGTMRGAWFHRGRHHDAEVYAIIRDDYNEATQSHESSAASIPACECSCSSPRSEHLAGRHRSCRCTFRSDSPHPTSQAHRTFAL